jgi:hypothetical protein
MDVFTFLRSESEGMELGEGEQGFRVQIDGRVEDADGARLWRPPTRMIDAGDQYLTYRRRVLEGYGIVGTRDRSLESLIQSKGFGGESAGLGMGPIGRPTAALAPDEARLTTRWRTGRSRW